MIFSVRQMQEKCREQNMPLYMAFIDLTKAFDLVSRNGLFQLLQKIGCPPKLLGIIESYHKDMHGVVSFDGATSEAFNIKSGVKQGCVLAPTLFGIFFSMLLKYAFSNTREGIFLHTRSTGKLFNLARLRAKTKIRKVLIREMLFADDAAVISHTEEGLQELIDCFSSACQKFGLTVSIKKTEVMSQNVATPPVITIDNKPLQVSDHFTYLGSTVSSNLSLDPEIDRRIGKAAGTMAKLHKRVWSNSSLRLKTKIKVYQACVISTLLYGSESWTTYAKQETRLEVFHLRCLRRILGITWEDHITNNAILESAEIMSIHSLLCQRRLRWLGHIFRMQDGRIPKDVLYGELSSGTRSIGRPALRFKDVCKRDLKKAHISVEEWEHVATNRDAWRAAVWKGANMVDRDRKVHAEEKRQNRKERLSNLSPTVFVCPTCRKDCHARIGLVAHERHCRKSKT